ncbi:hypothetical protein [Desulfosporosinus shakirovi]|uniref:hypothetical protein n=1 Tax=Desulfosporosinus shakirovi TaxID=2885154 RepID=UPI001E362BAA|nr:hypothetical protein [Desulfosporosinus sp. SRJS8]MCB8814314.1 hypothetical protein [Desulfosporosinus sp. SRJS8]
MSQAPPPKSPQKRNFLKLKPLKCFLQSSLYPGIFSGGHSSLSSSLFSVGSGVPFAPLPG